jgi:sodium-coupled neutral amino acid transporter 11
MARAKDIGRGASPAGRGDDEEEDVGLLAAHAHAAREEEGGRDRGQRLGAEDQEDEEDGLVVHHGERQDDGRNEPRSPRTPNRVRFDLRPTTINTTAQQNGHANGHAARAHRESFDLDEDDPLASPEHMGSSSSSRSGRDAAQRHSLLTDIEAPSVALANSPWGDYSESNVHDWAEAERARPKSGLRSAFMNMANSIIGAGIIGQPYAFRQAGLLTGVLLLVGLTVVVDWTICLIVVNSKLSGANSFQGTVEFCFGKPGLISISVAQWAFAFGGMVAFGVIVGDSIPHVLSALWPGLRDMPVLGVLADRRAVIVLFILSVSFPLTLYRDIAKVSLLRNPFPPLETIDPIYAGVFFFLEPRELILFSVLLGDSSLRKPAHWP